MGGVSTELHTVETILRNVETSTSSYRSKKQPTTNIYNTSLSTEGYNLRSARSEGL